MFKIVIGLLAGLFCASSWAATYLYNGNNYNTIVTGTTYNTGMRITGSFSTANPLPANMPITDISPSGSNLVLSWNFNDGFNNFTPANSYIPPGNFVVVTGPGGNITSYAITFFSPPSSSCNRKSHGGDDRQHHLGASGHRRIVHFTGRNHVHRRQFLCRDGRLCLDQRRGTFTLLASTTSVPTVTEWNLLLLGGLLVLLAAAVVRRRHAA
jgi:hypothetical protein